MTALYGVYGASGCGRGIMPLLRQQLSGQHARLVFIDDRPHGGMENGHDVVSWDQFLEIRAERRCVALAISSSSVRERLDRAVSEAGAELIGVRASNIVLMDDIEIGPGSLLSPFVTLTSNIRIGRCFHANLYSYIEHDCVIGDYVTFAPGVHCNGNIVIEDYAYIGAGAMIRQGLPGRPLTIGRGAIVGMGAVVLRDVPAGTVVAGNPARPIEKV